MSSAMSKPLTSTDNEGATFFDQVTYDCVPDGIEEMVETANHTAGNQPFFPPYAAGVEL